MRFLPTITLALIAFILGGLALIHTGDKYRSSIFGTPPISRGKNLFDMKEILKVRHVTLKNGSGYEVNFKLVGNHWEAESPWKDRADPLYMRLLFNFTATLKVEDIIPRKGLDLEKFGLRKQQVQVTMTDKDGNSICDYRIGRQAAWNPSSADGKGILVTHFIRFTDHYLKRNIYLCSHQNGQIQALFEDDFKRFRDHHPFFFSSQYLDKVHIQNSEGEVVLSRKNLHSPWHITKPLNLKVDPKALSQLFLNLGKLNAVKIDDRKNVTLPTAENSDSHSHKISIHALDTNKEYELNIYPPEKENDTVTLATINNRPNTVFYLPLTSSNPNTVSLSQFQTGVNDLRLKTMTQLNGPQLEKIIIRPFGSSPILLSRTKKTTWRVMREKGFKLANDNAVIALMTAVTRDKIEKFVTDAATDLTPYGLDIPFLQLGFVSFQHQGLAIAFGRGPKDGKIYAHLVGKPNIWQISPETLSKISILPWQWRTSNVWHIPKIDISNIEIQRKGKPNIQLQYAFFKEKWTAKLDNGKVKKDVTADLNPYRANTLLTHLASLKTIKWIGPWHQQAMKALKSPCLTIKVHLNSSDNEQNAEHPIVKTLKIAKTSSGLIYFAKVNTIPKSSDQSANEDEESYFLLSPESVKQLQVNLFE